MKTCDRENYWATWLATRGPQPSDWPFGLVELAPEHRVPLHKQKANPWTKPKGSIRMADYFDLRPRRYYASPFPFPKDIIENIKGDYLRRKAKWNAAGAGIR